MTAKTMQALRRSENRALLRKIAKGKGITSAQILDEIPGLSINTLNYRLRTLKNAGLIQREGGKYTVAPKVNKDCMDIDDDLAWAMASKTARIIIAFLLKQEAGITDISDHVQKNRKVSKAEAIRCLRELRLRGIVVKNTGKTKTENITLSINDNAKKMIRSIGL